MSPIPGVHIETLVNPCRYTRTEIEQVVAVAQVLQRGKFVLCVPPKDKT